jgi:DnaK suppressor protein
VTKASAKKPAASAAPAKKAVTKPVAARMPAAKTAAAPRPAAPVKPAAKAPAKPVAKPAPKPAAKALAAPAAKVPAPKAAAPKAAAPVPAARAAVPVAPLPAVAPRRPPPVAFEVRRPFVKIDPRLVNAWKTKAGRELTDDELLAMPDSEYMSEKQIDFFRARLQAQKNDLLSNADETTEHLREDTTIVPDPADRATIEEEHALELRTRDRERKLLKKIQQSLTRLDSGEYGFCDETGEPIGLARLLARPTATLSLEAQQRREMKQKMFGD